MNTLQLTIGGFPANSGTAQWVSFFPQSSNWSAQTSGMFVLRLAGVCPRTIRLQQVDNTPMKNKYLMSNTTNKSCFRTQKHQ